MKNSNLQARKRVENILDCEKKRPPLGKGETMLNVYLDDQDFQKPEDYARVRREANTGESGEIPAEVTGAAQRYRPGTYEDPPEGGYSEDVCVWVGGEDVSNLLTESSFEELQSRHYDDATDKEGAAMAEWEAKMEDRAADGE